MSVKRLLEQAEQVGEVDVEALEAEIREAGKERLPPERAERLYARIRAVMRAPTPETGSSGEGGE